VHHGVKNHDATLRTGLTAGEGTGSAYRLATTRLGQRRGLDLDGALRLAAAMEDDELVRKLELRK
jgi:hypothetical protein